MSLSGGIPSRVQSSYNAANQPHITRVHTYDANGNLRGDGVDSYTWDRHNRMVSSGAHSYTYDGNGNRLSQTVGGIVTRYLQDSQPGLAQMVAAITGSDTTRYLHSPRGIHAQQTPTGDWVHLLSDGLGSVRSVVDALSAPLEIRHYDPYGNPFGGVGTAQTDFGFTGEVTDANEQLYLRARYYAPLTGTFTALDPWEGTPARPMSLNGYSWVEGNTPNATDPSGMCMQVTICDNLPTWASWGCMLRNLIPPSMPTPTPIPMPCAMRDNNGVNVLGSTAITEADGAGGNLTGSSVATASLMIIQLNNFIASNGRWNQLGTWQDAGLTPQTVVANPSQTQIIDIATRMVEGYCMNPASPLTLVNAAYPSIAADAELQRLAGNPDARFEISIDATRARQFRDDPNYPLAYVVTVPGANRAIVIGGSDITNAWIEYQCPVGENAVIGTAQNPTQLGTLQLGTNVECKTCIRSTRQWWFTTDSQNWELLPESQFQSRRTESRFGGYIASCSE